MLNENGIFKNIRQRYCPIFKCVNHHGTPGRSGVKFFHAPTPLAGLAIRRQWIEKIQSHQEFDASVTNIGLCELHFDPKDIIEQRTRKLLKVGTVPTIFPVHKAPTPIHDHATDVQGTSDCLRNAQPKTSENTNCSNKKSTVLNCKQCIEIAVELSGATAKLYNLGVKLKKQENKIENMQRELERIASIPIRVDDSSQQNQNYIPQKTLKRKFVDPVQIDDTKSEDKRPKMANEQIAGTDFNRPNEQVEIVEENVEIDVTTNAECIDADDDGDPPNCERKQFSQYIMSSISEISERSAVHAMLAIKLFLQRWPERCADEQN